ncbi:hypothetical protein Tco_1324461 [Tanacetum coccineum]
MEGRPYARRLSKDEYRLVEDLTKNVPPRDILSILKAQNENNVSTIKDIYNAQYKIRKALQVGKSRAVLSEAIPLDSVDIFLRISGLEFGQNCPPQSEPHETIVIAHVYGNHYIKATLHEGCPLPITHPLWRTYRSDIASRWEDPYVSRQEEFREHYYRISEFINLSK